MGSLQTLLFTDGTLCVRTRIPQAIQPGKKKIYLGLPWWSGGQDLVHEADSCHQEIVRKGKEVKVLVDQSCPTLSDPMNCSPPGSSVHRISQARILEWVASSFSRRSSWPRNRTQSPACQRNPKLPHGLENPWLEDMDRAKPDPGAGHAWVPEILILSCCKHRQELVTRHQRGPHELV